MRILIVDDEARVGDLLRRELNDRGHDVHAVTSSKAALEQLGGGGASGGADGARAFDLVVTDLRMAPPDGLELLTEIVRTFQAPAPAAEAEFRELIAAEAGPVYGTSPDHPGKIVERRPDGSEVVGTLRGRQFIPDQAPARS